MDYRDAGVDVEAGRAFVQTIRDTVEATHRPGVLGNLGGFSGFFQLPTGYQEPVLVSGTDGVGTKLKIAHMVDRHNTVGIDLVAMCVNDILTSGAEPLFFLDYIATGALKPDQLTQVVAGIATGCQQAGCALLGGETAEMPGFYNPGEYDLAGFCVGIVEKSHIIDGSAVQVGDVAIALPSNGVHSNGFSLVRKIIDSKGYRFSDTPDAFNGASLNEMLLTPTYIYVSPVLDALRSGLSIHGMAHITGGGLPENLPRCLAANQAIRINLASWVPPTIFQWIAAEGDVAPDAMLNTFNMGVGFVVIVPSDEVDKAIEQFAHYKIAAWAIGEVIEGNGEVVFDA
ncbi:MAG: phosphoribosylformylglycinamidine cyclo-ligase [Cyanobacteria bacterium J06633_2]